MADEHFSVELPTAQQWGNAGDGIDRAVGRATELLAQEAWRNVMATAPVDEGRLAASWKLEKTGDLAWRIFTTVSYARYVSEGTVPHVIRPRNKRALAFKMGGTLVIVRKVNHPGTAPNPYVEEAVAKAETRAAEFVRRAVREMAA